MAVVESYSVWLLFYGFVITRSDRSWGIPLSLSSSSLSSMASFILRKRCVSTPPPTTNAELPFKDYQPHSGERIFRCYGYGVYRTDLSPSQPLARHCPSRKLSNRASFNPRRLLPWIWTLYPPDRRTDPTLFPSPDSTQPLAHRCSYFTVRLLHRRVISLLCAEVGQQRLVMGFISPSSFNCSILSPVSQPTRKWGILVLLAIFLKIFGGLTKVFTETILHLPYHLSCPKSIIPAHLPVGSPGPSLSSLASFLRRVFPPILWRCLSISITVLLSCGAVCSGPEDAAGFVSTSF
ncbi:hypothetical protein N665_0588s0047 [Sinapis alba]|nr:hypothetical protein N665_0588s0047 [Sinapis alba]